ncbi:DUF2182 domain-containing protein [Pseudorhodoplanes sp.]|uniref:DUF2182 domain-containing protein n=1 Tax=Pseudorhodoplanes sp. TaxID=1934341 RepID=UPI00391AE768
MTQLSAETRPLVPLGGPTRIAGLVSRPRPIAIACIAVLAAAGWGYLLFSAGVDRTGGAAAFLDAMCRAMPASGSGVTAAAFILAMWVAMTLAMMLPTAGPMILTYAEIAETAARKGERIVSPQVLIAGYMAVWLGFSLLATGIQLGLMSAASLPGAAALAYPASGLLLIAAGAYQFSSLKQVCLRVCQRPFSFFFLNWTDRPAGVFRLGLRQGLYCLGCCGAMMLLMFAAGAMNLVWMALLGIMMTIEKMNVLRFFSHAAGAAFVAAGGLTLALWGLHVVG